MMSLIRKESKSRKKKKRPNCLGFPLLYAPRSGRIHKVKGVESKSEAVAVQKGQVAIKTFI